MGAGDGEGEMVGRIRQDVEGAGNGGERTELPQVGLDQRWALSGRYLRCRERPDVAAPAEAAVAGRPKIARPLRVATCGQLRAV